MMSDEPPSESVDIVLRVEDGCVSLTNAAGSRQRTRCPTTVGVIRIGGHLSCGGYDVQTDGRHTEAASAPPVH
jgi:hypothetical protein